MAQLKRFSAPACALGLAVLSLSTASTPSFGAQKQQQTVKIELGTKGNELAFDNTAIHVKANQPVQLKFTNRADKSSGLQHNWVLTQPGKDQDVAALGVQAGQSKGYIPDSPAVIAHTQLLNPGESGTASFKAPATPGDYPYICTFPGHSQSLKGVLTVVK